MASNFVRRHLGYRLRCLREQAGLTRRDVQRTAIVRSTRILKALEDGHSTTVTYPTINELCRLYGASPAMRRETERMFRDVALPEWHEAPQNWRDNTALLMEIEQRATLILIYEPIRIHGLLQTEDYMRRGGYVHATDGEHNVDHVVRQRKQRQNSVWNGKKAAQASFVFGVGALRTAQGTDQVDVLRNYAEKTNVSIRVQPRRSAFENYAYPFTVLGFGEGEDGCAYTETISSHRYESQSQAVAAYTEFFESIFEQATPIEEIDDVDLYLA